MKNKMKIIKNKKASEGVSMPATEIIRWIILFAFLILAIYFIIRWGGNIIAIGKEYI